MTHVLLWHAQKYNYMIDQDGITLKRIFHLIWITMETSSTLETLNKIFWILHFSTATYDHWSSCYFRYIQHMRGHYLFMITTLWRSLAWHVSGARWSAVSLQFVFFHNDTRYTRKFKFSIGIAVMVSTNISYQPNYL